ncbi:hypothetical protein B0T18DRAFT_334096 [Schizothecium vesticola]|uniref:Methyltransferase n=1 Tax=Schizothecium vesticola TaxID=314040 RepID=A0AA40BQQ8_9PEZI|nr:hypothetical protein B0T18DRAFT_334096 [Schizothecium vesticola]
MSQVISSHIYYLAPLPRYRTEKPYYVNFPVTNVPGVSQHNVCHERYGGIRMHDIRGREDEFSLDTQGFQLTRHSTSMTNDEFEIDHVIREKYYPEVISLLTRVLGAAQVLPFEHTHRFANPAVEGCGSDRKRKPLTAAHIDQTAGATAQRIRYHMGEQADELLKGRYQIVNVWRPLFGPLRDFPLCLGDFRTFDLDRDGEPTDLVFPHFVGESMNLYQHPDHTWYFASDQMRDEVWMLKCYDSKDGVAKAAPHCSFDIQSGSFQERPRESVEVRCLVFYGAE